MIEAHFLWKRVRISQDGIHGLSAILNEVRPVGEQSSADQEDHVLSVHFEHFRDPIKAHASAGRWENGLYCSHGHFGPLRDAGAFLSREAEPSAEVGINACVRSREPCELAEQNRV